MPFYKVLILGCTKIDFHVWMFKKHSSQKFWLVNHLEWWSKDISIFVDSMHCLCPKSEQSLAKSLSPCIDFYTLSWHCYINKGNSRPLRITSHLLPPLLKCLHTFSLLVYVTFLRHSCQLIEKRFTVRKWNVQVRPVRFEICVVTKSRQLRVQYACTLLMTKIALRTLYEDLGVQVKMNYTSVLISDVHSFSEWWIVIVMSELFLRPFLPPQCNVYSILCLEKSGVCITPLAVVLGILSVSVLTNTHWLGSNLCPFGRTDKPYRAIWVMGMVWLVKFVGVDISRMSNIAQALWQLRPNT